MLAALNPLQRLLSPLNALMTSAERRFGPPVRYAIGPSAYGRALVAVCEGQIREIALGENDAELVAGLKRRFPQAAPAKGDPLFWDAGLEAFLAIEEVALPSDLAQVEIGAAFQQAVRDQLDERDGRPARKRVTLH